jgi:hypothetical protein
MIISNLPEVFDEFPGKRCSLPWRGNRDGFGANDLHDRCDDDANTLTIILDTKGNIFGGFTLVKWDSTGRTTGQKSLKNFLFTLKNPHNVAARKFGLKPEGNRSNLER